MCTNNKVLMKIIRLSFLFTFDTKLSHTHTALHTFAQRSALPISRLRLVWMWIVEMENAKRYMRIHSSMSLFTSFKLNLLKFVHMRSERASHTNVYKIAFGRCRAAARTSPPRRHLCTANVQPTAPHSSHRIASLTHPHSVAARSPLWHLKPDVRCSASKTIAAML